MLDRRTLILLVLALSSATALAAAPAGAPKPAPAAGPQPLQTARLLGGYETLAIAGVGRDVPRAQVIPTLIRILHNSPKGTDPHLDDIRDRLHDTLTTLAAVDSVGVAWPDGLSIAQAADKQKKKLIEASLGALGLELHEQRGAYDVRDDGGVAAAALRKTLTDAGVAVADVRAGLNAGRAVRIAVPEITVPMPMPRSAWENAVFHRATPEAEWIAAVLDDPRASLLGYGLLALDEETRGWLAADRQLLTDASQHWEAFAVVAPALHVTATAIQLPGGAPAALAWEAVAGAKPADPSRFFRALLSADEGRLAFFFATIAGLDEPRLRLVLGGNPPTRNALRWAYDAFADPVIPWTLANHPFMRRRMDGAVILRALAVDASGRLAGPTWEKVWQSAFDSDDLGIKGTMKGLEKDRAIDARWIVQHVLSLPQGERDARLQVLLFAQRAFPHPQPQDAIDILVALRGYQRFPAAAALLERMGVTAPATYASVLRGAEHAANVSADHRQAVLSQFQGALAILDRLRARGALTTAAAERSALDLAALVPDAGWYHGRVAAWLDETIAKVPGGADADADARQRRLIDALAGVRPSQQPATFMWESEQYQVATGEAERERIDAVVKQQLRPDVAAVLRLSAAVTAVGKAATVDALRQAAANVSQLLGALVAPAKEPQLYADLLGDARNAIKDLQKIDEGKEMKKAETAIAPIRRLLDLQTSFVLRLLDYAVFMPSEDNGSMADVAARHDFGGETGATDAVRARAAWLAPSEVSEEGGWRLRGSLLAMDVATGRFAVRRLSAAPPSHPPTLVDNTRLQLAQTLALTGSAQLTDAGRDAIAVTIARGRDRVRAAASTPGTSIPAPAGMSAWRREALAWTAANDAAHLEAQFTVHELYALGAAPGSTSPDGWGTAQTLTSGCLCLKLLTLTPWEELAGRNGTTVAVASASDLSLRLAEHLSALKVPAALLPAVLAFATSDVIENAESRFEEDSMALSRAAQALTRQQVEDIVASVVGRGLARPQ